MRNRKGKDHGAGPHRAWFLVAILVLALTWAVGPVHARSFVASPAQQATTTLTTTDTPTPTSTSTGTASATSTTTDTVTPTSTPTETPTTTPTALPPGEGASNIIKVVNQTDNRLRADGKVQINHISASNVSPTNEALASSSCAGCQTFAVALQVNLVGTNVTLFHPQNVAVAINNHCSNCDTAAWAYQYNLSVADPDKIPHGVTKLVRAMNKELRGLRGKSTSVSEAKTAIEAVITQFRTLANQLRTGQVETTKDKDKKKKQQQQP